MVTLQILVLSFQVRILVAQQSRQTNVVTVFCFYLLSSPILPYPEYIYRLTSNSRYGAIHNSKKNTRLTKASGYYDLGYYNFLQLILFDALLGHYNGYDVAILIEMHLLDTSDAIITLI